MIFQQKDKLTYQNTKKRSMTKSVHTEHFDFAQYKTFRSEACLKGRAASKNLRTLNNPKIRPLPFLIFRGFTNG